MTGSIEKCPVDHSSSSSSSSVWSKLFGGSSSHKIEQVKPVEQQCPVDHSSSKWATLVPPDISKTSNGTTTTVNELPTDRITSSIPRTDAQGNWIYPSHQQFFKALARKNHNPREADMKIVVPIHNAVNERAWKQILEWESGQGGEACGGVRLATFRGRPNDTSPKAWWKTLLGYQKPFDRHDWIVDRCGTQIRYVIDFYTGKSSNPSTQNLSFYLDVRPALDNWEGCRMRIVKFWDGLMLTGSAPPNPTTPTRVKSS